MLLFSAGTEQQSWSEVLSLRSDTFPPLGSANSFLSLALLSLWLPCKLQCHLIACAAICNALNVLVGTRATTRAGVNVIFCSLVASTPAGKQQECPCGVCAKELKMVTLLDSSLRVGFGVMCVGRMRTAAIMHISAKLPCIICIHSHQQPLPLIKC